MTKKQVVRILLFVAYMAIAMSIVLLIHYGSTPSVGLGFLMIGIIFLTTIAYFVLLVLLLHYLSKRINNVHSIWIVLLINLEVLPVLVHLQLLDRIHLDLLDFL